MPKFHHQTGPWAFWAKLLLKLPPTLLFHLLLALAVLTTIVQVPAFTEVYPAIGAGLFAAVLFSAMFFALLAAWGGRLNIEL